MDWEVTTVWELMKRQWLPSFACWRDPVSAKWICHCSISAVGAWAWHLLLSITKRVPDLLGVKAPIDLFLFAIDVCKVCNESLPHICIQQQTASGMHCNAWSVKVLNVSKCPTLLKTGNLCIVSGPDFSCPIISKWLTFSFATCQITIVLGNIGRTM